MDTGLNWKVMRVECEAAMELLRSIFPDATADERNFVLFSTSGIHGSYLTIEDIEIEGTDSDHQLTFLIVRPRIVALQYGNCVAGNPEDIAFLKQLRSSSWDAVSRIGRDHSKDDRK
jgi:hypothetical protein